MHAVGQTKQNPSTYQRARTRSLGKGKKEQEVIYNSLVTLETACTQLAGEEGARRKPRKEQSLGQPDICCPVYRKIFSQKQTP